MYKFWLSEGEIIFYSFFQKMVGNQITFFYIEVRLLCLATNAFEHFNLHAVSFWQWSMHKVQFTNNNKSLPTTKTTPTPTVKYDKIVMFFPIFLFIQYKFIYVVAFSV